MWLIADYQEKTGIRVRNAEVNTTDDGKFEIVFKDKNNETLMTYIIDPATGKGTNSANEEVSLPKTGNNSMTIWFIIGSLLLSLLGLLSS